MFLLKTSILLLISLQLATGGPCCCKGDCSEKQIEKKVKYVTVPSPDKPFTWEESDKARLLLKENLTTAEILLDKPTKVAKAVAKPDVANQEEPMLGAWVVNEIGSLCDDGWELFKESCYYIEREEKLPLDQAEQSCIKKGATLFVANSKEEFNTILQDAPMNYFTWTGLYKKGDDTLPTWHTKDAIDLNELNWIIQPYSDATNGWTTVSQCAAHYNPFTAFGKYTFWYPCSFAYYYVCERNATLATTSMPKLFN
ncbi:unnamed protein product [Auanema sp. JU1783]|nr:unnamed protein product [Auanema sp. JU1783]